MQRIVQLTPPCLSPNNIKEKITGVRAHRERIFQVYNQNFGDKTVIHNYGHGGAGWTFLFGCVNEAIRLFERELGATDMPICVIGAGCYGLLTAIMLARKGHTVKILAKDTESISSNKAAGFFFPRHRKCSTPEEIAIFQAMGMESYRAYQQIIAGEHPFIKMGPKLLPAYFGLDIDPGFGPYIDQGLIDAPEHVLIDFQNGKSYSAIEYQVIYANPSAIMAELWRNVRDINIPVIQKDVQAFDDCEESIIFNCAGMGAKELAQDRRIVPVQGHLITLQNQPDVNELQYLINFKVTQRFADGSQRDELIYFAPKDSGILGITFKRGVNSLEANQFEFNRLLERSRDFFGS